ncbi:hypothetical protein BD779DRAFT_1673051 [Infundibulicybe gibba]|nr:hypothetical protein BD779DRAFT_1673051 [Infundibulicybe gibba]
MDEAFLSGTYFEEMLLYEPEDPVGAMDQQPDDEDDNAALDLSDDEDSEPADPISLASTRSLKAKLKGQDVLAKVLAILSCMRLHGMNLPIFLDALSWGDPGCHSDRTIQYARTSLMVSEELPGILNRWYKPPQALKERKGRRLLAVEEVDGRLIDYIR